MLKENVLRSNMNPDSLENKILILGFKYGTVQTSFKLKKNLRASATAGAWKSPLFHMF